MKRRAMRVLGVVFIGLGAGGCGYHVAGHGQDALPKTIHVIAVPSLENKTNNFKIEQRLTAATIHEFLAKTRYKVVSNPDAGEATPSTLTSQETKDREANLSRQRRELKGTTDWDIVLPLAFKSRISKLLLLILVLGCLISFPSVMNVFLQSQPTLTTKLVVSILALAYGLAGATVAVFGIRKIG